MIFILFSYNVFCSLAWSQPRNQSLGEVTTSHLSQVIIIKVVTKPDEKLGFKKLSLHFYDLNNPWLDNGENGEVYVCMSVCRVFAYFDILFHFFSV